MSEKLRVAVLMGGTSAERAVSLATGKQILSSLNPEKYAVYALDTATGETFRPELLAGTSARLLHAPGDDAPVTTVTELTRVAPEGRPDVVFVALHGPGGEDGTVQGFLEMLGVRYTGSGVLASALAMDKMRAKILFGACQIPVPAGLVFQRGDALGLRRAGETVGRKLGFPAVVKPNRQGSSFGTTIVRSAADVRPALDLALRYDDTALVEERLEGIEITVAVLGNRTLTALPPVEIVSKGDGFFDYEAKYSSGETGAVEIVPARITADQTEEAQSLALECHRVLGCRGMSRTDMFVTEDGCVVLETNTIPGMTPTSLLPKAAAAAGISFAELLDRLVGYAQEGQ